MAYLNGKATKQNSVDLVLDAMHRFDDWMNPIVEARIWGKEIDTETYQAHAKQKLDDLAAVVEDASKADPFNKKHFQSFFENKEDTFNCIAYGAKSRYDDEYCPF